MSGGLDAELELTLGAFRLDAALSAPGEGVTALVGPSGSGKSTLLRCLAGLERPRGRIRLGDEVWLDSERCIFVPPHRRGAALVFQDAAPFAHLRVRGNLEYALARAPRARSRVSFDEAVAWLGVGPLLGRRTGTLSGGERQRVAIARALLAGPRLLLLDEPLASLDAAARGEILELLRRLFARAPVPVLYVTHSRSEALHLARHVAVLEAGRVRAAGPLREVALCGDALPFGGPDELSAVVDAEVAEVDAAHGLSLLRFAGGTLAVTGLLALGERRRLEILARDVSLALERPRRTSILNVLPARVLDVRDPASFQPVVVLDVGGTPLLARISRRSLVQLGVAPGAEVFAQVKGVAVIA